MQATGRNDQLQQEQNAFNAALPELSKEHYGEYVIFKDARPAAFSRTIDDAYRLALRTFGLDAVFFISRVAERPPGSISLAWDMGVMYTD